MVLGIPNPSLHPKALRICVLGAFWYCPSMPDKAEPIYRNTIDAGTFAMKVTDHPDKDRWGILEVTVVSSGEVLLKEDVPLSYGAIFGPDVDDVDDWQAKADDVDDWQAKALGVIDPYIDAHNLETDIVIKQLLSDDE